MTINEFIGNYLAPCSCKTLNECYQGTKNIRCRFKEIWDKASLNDPSLFPQKAPPEEED